MKMNWNKSIIKFTWNKLFVLVMVMIGKSLAAMPAYAMTPVEADIPFIVKGTPGTVRIEAENDAPLSEETEQTVEGNGKFIIQYTEPDNYVYHVYELPDGDNGVVYDTTDYQVMVSVMVDDDGNLIPRLSLSTKHNNEKPMEITEERIETLIKAARQNIARRPCRMFGRVRSAIRRRQVKMKYTKVNRCS